MTSGEPPFAHSIAHCLLTGLVRPLVKAHAESKTKPFTVTVWLSAPLTYTAVASKTKQTALKAAVGNFIVYSFLRIYDMDGLGAQSSLVLGRAEYAYRLRLRSLLLQSG